VLPAESHIEIARAFWLMKQRRCAASSVKTGGALIQITSTKRLSSNLKLKAKSKPEGSDLFR
jgi:hypothetical protein